MSVLRQFWMDERAAEEVKTTYQYVVDLQNRLEDVGKLSWENLEVARGRQRKYYNAKTKERTFSPGDMVLLLRPQEHNKLQVSWRGPYIITARSGGQNYKIRVGDREKKHYHHREKALVVATVVTEKGELQDITASTIPSFPLTPTETFKDVVLDGVLPVTQQEEALAILAKHQDVLTKP